MSTPEDRVKEISLYLRNIITKRPRIVRNFDEKERNYVDAAVWDGIPDEGLATVLTLDLSYYPLIEYGKPYTKGKAELMAICHKSDQDFMIDVVATCAHCVINSKWFCAPRAVFPDVISMYDDNLNMKHVFFDFPRLYPEHLSKANIGGVSTMWLMIVPISESEYQYAINVSVEALQELLNKHQIDCCDLNRPSVV